MRASSWVFLLRCAALIALMASVALLVDYTRPDPAFCGGDSGCGAVRESGLGYLPFFGLGVLPLPVLGVAAFAMLFSATLLSPRSLRPRVAHPLALLAGVSGLGLIAVQAFIGHFCSLCLIVDVAALVAAVAAVNLRGKTYPEDDPKRTRGPVLPVSSWMGLCLLAVAAPAFYTKFVQTSEVPGVIRGLYKSDGVTIVEFFDYQCPHCRALSPRLKKLAEQEGAHMRFGYTPLPGNDFARAAARASICAAEQGKEAEVTSYFFSLRKVPEGDLVGAVSALVPDAQALKACLDSKRPDERIAEDTRIIKQADFKGLPTTYIGGTRLLGALDDAVYRDAIARARDGSDTGGLSPVSYVLVAILAAAALVLLGRRPSAKKS